jgi:hypothetical protein
MDGINSEVVAAIAVVVVVASLFFGRKRQPKERTFKCARCSAVSAHSSRTFEAWRAGKTKFFCNACHGQWLRSRPPQVRDSRPAYPERSGNSGCLGVMLVFILLPAVAVIAWWAYA